MYWLWAMHIFQFALNRNLFVLSKGQITDDEYQRVSSAIESSEDHPESIHYRYMKREFHSNKYIWIVQTVFYIGVLIGYMFTHGKEIIYDLWVPLDLLIFVSMGIYAFTQYRIHECKKQKVGALSLRKSSKVNRCTGLLLLL